MEASIFNKPLNDVDYNDVVRFCDQQIREGLNLDYKRDLSSMESIVKTLVSFANTTGGWVIVGVGDANDMPALPVEGIDHHDNFVEKINSSIISSVSPAVLPFYKVAKSEENEKSFIVIYMPQSPSAPHWFNYKKKKNALLIRIADRTGSGEWVEDASGTIWEHLRSNREKAVQRSAELTSEQRKLFETKAYLDNKKRDVGILAALSGKGGQRKYFRGAQTVVVSPAYPSVPITTVRDTKSAIEYEKVSNQLNMSHATTPDVRGDSNFYQSGYYTHYWDSQVEGHYFFCLDVYGNILSVDPIERQRVISGEETTLFVEYSEIISHIAGVLRFASGFYAKHGMAGYVNVAVDFESRDFANYLFFTHSLLKYDTGNLPTNLRGFYRVERIVDTNLLSNEDTLKTFVADIIEEVFYSFNYPGFDRQVIEKLV